MMDSSLEGERERRREDELGVSREGELLNLVDSLLESPLISPRQPPSQ